VSKPRSRFKAFKHLLAYVVLRVVWMVLSVLPERMLYALGSGLGWLLALTPLRRKAVENIRRAYGDAPPSAEYPTADALARGCLRHYGWLFAEAILLDRWQPKLLDHTEGDRSILVHFKQLFTRGNGLIVATGHLGNWEMMARCLAAFGFNAHSMAREAFGEQIARWLVDWRKRAGVTIINRHDRESLKALRATMKQGAGLGVLVDVDTKVKSTFVPFFGTLAKTPTAAADLALKLDAPLLVGWSWRVRPGLFSATAVEIPTNPTEDHKADVERITLEVTRLLEAAIRAHPEQWIWTHRRWRSRPDG